ncbi:uncharacterized protein BCR38DRAFT_350493, partial [Pseudomassariella vexata]
FVLEHLSNIDKVLLNCELAGATVAAEKSQWCQKEAVLVGYLCTPYGRHPDQSKVLKQYLRLIRHGGSSDISRSKAALTGRRYCGWNFPQCSHLREAGQVRHQDSEVLLYSSHSQKISCCVPFPWQKHLTCSRARGTPERKAD